MSQLNNEEKKSITDELLEKVTEENVEPIVEIKDDETNKEYIEIKEEKTISEVEKVKEKIYKEQPVENNKANTEKMNINMIKNKGSKKLIIFLIIFTIIAILITALLISHKNKEKSQDILDMPQEENEIVVENDKTELVDESHLAIKSITELYSENSITIEEKEIKYGKVKDENGEEVYKVNITYPQISGLKNKTVQDKINKEIKEKVLSYYDENILNDEKIRGFDIWTQCKGNFSDILSISIDVRYEYNEKDKEGEYKYEYISKSLNYRLDTGEQILFRDIFLNTTNIEMIVQKNLYMSLLEKIKYETEEAEKDEEFVIDYENADYSEFENEMVNYMRQYREKGISFFYFDNDYLYFGIGDLDIEIDLEEIMQEIAIYRRFLSKENLYEDLNIGRKNLFVFSNMFSNYYKAGHYLDNLYIDVSYYNYDEEDYNEEESQKEENEMLDFFLKEYINIAKNNPKTVYIVQGYIEVDTIKLKSVSKSLSYTTMSKEYYEREGKEFLASKQRREKYLDEEMFFYESQSNKNMKVKEISESYYVDDKFNKLSFLEVQKQFGEDFSKVSKIEERELPKITYQNNFYTYDYTALGGEVIEQEINTENIRNKKLSGLSKVESYEQKEFEHAKEEIRAYLKEELNIDVTNSLKQLEIRHSENVDSYDYLGGYYILKGDNYDGETLRTAIFKYIMTQSNTSSDSIFADSNGREQNKVIKHTLAAQLAKYCCTSYEEEDIQANDKQLLITKLLLEMYGENLLKDALTGRKSVVEEEIKELMNETTYDGCVYALDNYYLGDSLEQEYVTTYLTMLNMLQIYKDYSYDVFN